MNAGCYGYSFGDYVSAIEGRKRDGSFIKLSKKELDFSYRKCRMLDELIVTSVTLKPMKLQRELIEEKMLDSSKAVAPLPQIIQIDLTTKKNLKM